MAKDTHYFKHDSDAHTDLMIKAMLKKYGWQGYGWWWYIIEKLRGQDGYHLEYEHVYFESIAEDLKCDGTEIKDFIDSLVTYKLIKITKQDGVQYFHSPRLTRDMSHYDEVIHQRQSAGQRSGISRASKATPDPNVISAALDLLDPDLAEIITLWEDNKGQMSKYTLDELSTMYDEEQPGWLLDSMKESLNQGKMSLAYIKAILKRWHNEGRDSKKKQEEAYIEQVYEFEE